MPAGNHVQWDLVDYGPGVFHVASLHQGMGDRPTLEMPRQVAEPATKGAAEGCFLLRCWSARRDDSRAA